MSTKKAIQIAAMIAVNPVKVGGAVVAPGGEFEIEERFVEQLLASGSARRKGDDVPAASGGDGGDGGGDDEQASWAKRVEAIKSVIANLEAEDPEKKNDLLWRKDKTPRMQAVADRLDFKPTAEDLEDALKVMAEEKVDG